MANEVPRGALSLWSNDTQHSEPISPKAFVWPKVQVNLSPRTKWPLSLRTIDPSCSDS